LFNDPFPCHIRWCLHGHKITATLLLGGGRFGLFAA